MWDLIVSVPDHCLSYYFSEEKSFENVDDGRTHEGCLPIL